MATFELQGPDGGTYQVDAPDAASAVSALHGGARPPQSADANPFNREMGADASYGAPLQAPVPTPALDRAGELRAMAGGPITDRMASAAQTYLPEMLGGTGQDYGTNLAQNRQDTAAAQAAHPASNIAGDVGSAAGYAALAPASIGGAIGAGALSSAASSPDWSNIGQTAKDAAIGGGIGLGAGLVGKGIGAMMRPAAEGVPTAANIGSLTNEAYQNVKNLGAAYRPGAFSDLAAKIGEEAKAANISPDLNPRASKVIDWLQGKANEALSSGQPVSLTDLDQARKFVSRNVLSSNDPAETFFGKQIQRSIDDFISSAGPAHMASGAGDEAAAAIRNARDLAQRGFKTGEVADNLAHAELMAGKSISGNADSTSRTALLKALEGGSNWSPEETALLKKGVMGTRAQNIARGVGRVAPAGLIGLGEGALAGTAMLAGHPAGAAILGTAAGAGQAGKFAANQLGKANIEALTQAILNGGKAPVRAPIPTGPTRAALAAALAGYGAGSR